MTYSFSQRTDRRILTGSKVSARVVEVKLKSGYNYRYLDCTELSGYCSPLFRMNKRNANSTGEENVTYEFLPPGDELKRERLALFDHSKMFSNFRLFWLTFRRGLMLYK